MKFFNIKDMKNGWFVGNFEPTAIKTPEFEIAHHIMPKGSKADPHMHKIARELNYIIKGKILVGGLNGNEVELSKGDIFIYEPGEIADGIAMEDTEFIAVKIPSVANDKYKKE